MTDYIRVVETLTSLGLTPEQIGSNITLAEDPEYWKTKPAEGVEDESS